MVARGQDFARVVSVPWIVPSKVACLSLSGVVLRKFVPRDTNSRRCLLRVEHESRAVVKEEFAAPGKQRVTRFSASVDAAQATGESGRIVGVAGLTAW
jgi:hypothetical protein